MKKNTSWQGVSRWYQQQVGYSGHYYHQQVILPKSLKLLNLTSQSLLLDLGCGNGVLARQIPQGTYYLGIDASTALIKLAQKQDHNPRHYFQVADMSKKLELKKKDFTHASIILALQNFAEPKIALQNIAEHLSLRGKLLIVLNHPCFRIPRQSSWGIDEQNKLQYRRINRYLSPLKIPIQMQPGKRGGGQVTWSFHYSLSYLSQALFDSNFVINKIEEWTSDKNSQGSAATRENRARKEFPLFMAILATKQNYEKQ